MSGRTLVTGAAGFIGSHLAERLLEDGGEVVAVDCFTDYYARALKERNLDGLRGRDGFEFVEADLASADLEPILRDVTGVCHLAAQAGVRASWGRRFRTYVDCNIIATQRLLEAVVDRPIEAFVYASSSSVYGDTDDLPMREESATRPVSPYGVTKLAAEHMAMLYHRNHGVPAVALRYFTVFGPRQRPDMAFFRFLRAALEGGAVSVFGDGRQTRDFTFVADAVEATRLALFKGVSGEVLNVGGGNRVTLNEALDLVEKVAGAPVARSYEHAQRGDVTDTLADARKAARLLGFAPRIGLEEGLAHEHEWMRSLPRELLASQAGG